MGPEELQALLAGLQGQQATRESELAQALQDQEEAAILSAVPLENQLNALQEQQQGARQALLQNRFDVANNVLQNANSTGFAGLASTLDAIDGTNFSKQAQALANQNALIARGGDPASQIANEQLNINQDEQASLQADLAKQQAQAAREQVKLEKELAQSQKAQNALELQEFKFANELRKEQDRQVKDLRKEERADARFAQQQANQDRNFGARQARSSAGSNKQASGEQKSSGRTSLFGFLDNVASETLPGFSKSKRTDTFVKPLNSIKKQAQDEIKISSRARTALRLLNDPDPNKALRKVSISAIQGMLARASGEVGALTEADKAAFSGQQSLFSNISRKLRTGTTSDLNPEDIEGLKLLAGQFIQGSTDRVAIQARSSISQVRASLGVSDQELLDNGVIDFIGVDGLTADSLGLSGGESAAPATSSGGSAQASGGFDIDAFLDEQGDL